MHKLLLGAMCGVVFAGQAAAATEASYTPQAFAAAQAEGKPILVHITAPWCPICKAQHPILSKLEMDPRFGDLDVFNVDFDHQKDVVRQFGATMQSTLVAFHGKDETARSVGDTGANSIAALLDKTLTQ